MRNLAGHKTKLILAVILVAGALGCSVAFARQMQNPIQAAKDAYNKAKQQQQQQKQQGQQQTAPQTGTQPANTQSQPPARGQAAGADAAAPWTPPSDTASAPAGPLDPSKLPDAVGIHLGMPAELVPVVIKQRAPGSSVNPQVLHARGGGGPGLTMGVTGGGHTNGDTQFQVNFTWPPNKQVVFYVEYTTRYPHPIAHQNMVDALRQKYGKETLATDAGRINSNQGIATKDSEISGMWWMFDEQGRRVPPGKVIDHSPYGCKLSGGGGSPYVSQLDDYLRNGLPAQTFCDSVIVVLANIGDVELVSNSAIYISDQGLFFRSVKATGDWQRAQAEKQRQDELEKAKQAKPTL